MRVSRIVLLVVALFAGGLAAFLALRGGSQPAPAPAPEARVVEEQRAQILVAKAPIGMGERLSPDNVEWQPWPANAVQPSFVTQAAMPEAITDMTDAVVRFEFFAGEPIRGEKLVRSEQGYLSAVLAEGMRGISIAVNADSASGGFILPNDHVDVILTHTGPNGEMSETILSNVRVLAINTRLGELGSSGGQADTDNSDRTTVFNDRAIATLELDPGQGETLINAGRIGALSLALRSILDFDAPQGGPGEQNRNQPIRIIRYGEEASVMAGTMPASLTENGDLATPPVSVSTTTGIPLTP